MKRIYFPSRVIISGYGSLLLLVGFIFLLHDSSLHRLESAVPVAFILRFCIFWFISIVFALACFMVNLQVNYFTDTDTDRVKARRAGILALAIAAFGTLVAIAAVYAFRF